MTAALKQHYWQTVTYSIVLYEKKENVKNVRRPIFLKKYNTCDTYPRTLLGVQMALRVSCVGGVDLRGGRRRRPVLVQTLGTTSLSTWRGSTSSTARYRSAAAAATTSTAER